jgi:hypothetical protein
MCAACSLMGVSCTESISFCNLTGVSFMISLSGEKLFWVKGIRGEMFWTVDLKGSWLYWDGGTFSSFEGLETCFWR